MSSNEVLLEKTDSVATLFFNRPESKNAMNPAMRDAFIENLDALAGDDSVSVLVLRGKGESFIAGGDLQAFAATLELEPDERRNNFYDRVMVSAGMVSSLVNFPKPVIAVIEGDAAGAGISLALCCDFVLATTNSRYSFAHAHVGLALDLGLSYFLPRAAGTLQAKRLAMLGQTIPAEEAYRLGLVTTLVEKDDVNEALSSLLSSLRKMPLTALQAIKREFKSSSAKTLEEQLECEAEAVGDCAATDAFKKRVTAFVSR